MSTDPETLLNTLLEGRSDSFKAKVLEIVYRHGIDPQDPNLQILIATGQLEVLLEEAPERLEASVTQLLETVIQDYKTALAQEAHEVIQLAARELQGSWAVRVALPGAIAALLMTSLGFVAGWFAKSAQVYQHYSPAELQYLAQLWQWNSDRLLHCQQQRQSRCSIRVLPPEKRSTNQPSRN